MILELSYVAFRLSKTEGTSEAAKHRIVQRVSGAYVLPLRWAVELEARSPSQSRVLIYNRIVNARGMIMLDLFKHLEI